MPAAQPLLRATTFSNTNTNNNPTHRIRLVPHLDSRHTFRFEPITRDLKDNDSPLRISRFRNRSGISLAAVNALNTNKLAFKSKVVSRAHAEIWSDNAKFYIKDTKSSSGTFLNLLRLSPAGSESKPHQLKDGDIVQLGVDYQGGTEDIYKSVKIRIEVVREWQAAPNAFNTNALSQLRSLSADPHNQPQSATAHGKKRMLKINPDCCICLFAVTIRRGLFIAPCSHAFHYKCIRPLLEAHSSAFSCPLCRTFADLDEDVEVEIEPEPEVEVIDAISSPEEYDDDDEGEGGGVGVKKLDDASDERIRKLRQQYLSPTEVEDAIKRAIHAHLENAPLRLLDTSTGRLCVREAQINAFMDNMEYKKLLSSSMAHARLKTQSIQEEITKFFSWVMLSHRWESKELLLHDIQGKVVYDLDPVGTTVKLQMFCNIARDAGYRWAWSDTCCIDQNNNVEVQRSVNSMFIWYRQSALTIVYLSDVPPSAMSGALANSVWNTRGWTVQEFLAPYVVLFYQQDWTVYLNDHSLNHKDSVIIMQELEDSTGINAQALVAFRPGMTGAREKLQWASTRVTTLQEDIAYSLFGIFRIHLPVIYGETKQNALGRLIQEIIARSGDISALDWVGKSSEFNSCLPANIYSYKTIPYTLPLREDEMQISVSRLQNTVTVESVSNLYTLLYNVNAPRFANSRLQLPCIVFPVTAVRRRHSQEQEMCFTYDVKADGLRDLLITTEDKLTQFSRARSARQLLLLVRPWNRHDLELPDLEDDAQSADDWSEPKSPSNETLSGYTIEDEPVDLQSHLRALRLIARLGQPFGAFLLAQQRGGEYKRIASDHSVIAQVKDVAYVDDMMDIRTLEIL